MRRFFVFFPEYDLVTEDQIMAWAAEALSNGMIGYMPEMVEEAMELLSDTGKFIFGEEIFKNTKVMNDDFFVEQGPSGLLQISFE